MVFFMCCIILFYGGLDCNGAVNLKQIMCVTVEYASDCAPFMDSDFVYLGFGAGAWCRSCFKYKKRFSLL